MEFLISLLNALFCVFLLVCFIVVFPAKKLSLTFGALFAIFCVQTVVFFDKAFYSLFNVFLMGGLFLCMFMARKSPNFILPISLIAFVKFVEILTQAITVQWGAGHYLLYSGLDFILLLVVVYRASITKCLAKSSIPYLGGWASNAEPNLKYSIQDMGLIVIYSGYLFANVTGMLEKLVRDYTDFTPMFFYHLYPIIKFPLNLIEILLIFSVAAGYAKGVYTKKQFA